MSKPGLEPGVIPVAPTTQSAPSFDVRWALS
jgi:hypothetical protein